ncbi:hypothetical protein PGT21_026339 [Puccinia graminis f. sp. tritici]|uniref:Uncharacterized protein n=2 Tax=Puccinia graminis f. sp. tritici TaxID=56615 RepID=E3KNW7_PUCGT|nr:uncharacterized protein PGTG_11748 [Puccinia graminis f. sp. tritici CRL 75-36-700-3]EFP85992.1 hypothetical protein PGTG_11748 [Puccinia graminis f. sp. tritici CRL 75-36-700-3]KAA1069163.1 hypothetical protein PGT21_014806 [Puccinia graminis f. sp. tritici]KAA1073821.1 hypothetical protein PGT21_026339 [Puccinia graminis f. sp. tritici]
MPASPTRLRVTPESKLDCESRFAFRTRQRERLLGFQFDQVKRAVGGVDHSLSFSFHNNSSTFLTTNTISLPFGTVLRNNGLDPLPHCHPLPLKPSQSSPSSLDYPSSLPPRLQQAEHFLQPGQHLASSASNPDFFDEQQYDRSPAPDQNFSIPPPNEAHRRTDEDSSHPLSRHHREIDDTLHPPKSPSIVPDDAPTLILTRCVRYGR